MNDRLIEPFADAPPHRWTPPSRIVALATDDSHMKTWGVVSDGTVARVSGILADTYGDAWRVAPTKDRGTAMIVGLAPTTVAMTVRALCKVLHHTPALPRSVEMLQLVGIGRVSMEAMRVGRYYSLTRGSLQHLLLQEWPWCVQFRNVLRAALSDDPAAITQVRAEDTRLLLLEPGDSVRSVAPLLECVGTPLLPDFTVHAICNDTHFWHIGHYIMMDWPAVTGETK